MYHSKLAAKRSIDDVVEEEEADVAIENVEADANDENDVGDADEQVVVTLKRFVSSASETMCDLIVLNEGIDFEVARSKSTISRNASVDGWTNTARDKVTNVLLICGGKSLYWRSITNSFQHNTAEWLAANVSPILRELIEKGVQFAGVALDHEATDNAFFDVLNFRNWKIQATQFLGQVTMH